MRTIAADSILIVHFLFIGFVVGGLLITWIGAGLGWDWVRNLWFRVTHLAAILFVVGESLAGVWCPLTLWEDALRGSREDMSFVARWIHRLMFYSFPEWVFTLLYVAFAAVVVLTLWLVPPRGLRRRH